MCFLFLDYYTIVVGLRAKESLLILSYAFPAFLCGLEGRPIPPLPLLRLGDAAILWNPLVHLGFGDKVRMSRATSDVTAALLIPNVDLTTCSSLVGGTAKAPETS